MIKHSPLGPDVSPSWARVAAGLLEQGGEIRCCTTCGRPHAVRLVALVGNQLVVTEEALDAGITSLEATLAGRRPHDCRCHCCAWIHAETEHLLDAEIARLGHQGGPLLGRQGGLCEGRPLDSRSSEGHVPAGQEGCVNRMSTRPEAK